MYACIHLILAHDKNIHLISNKECVVFMKLMRDALSEFVLIWSPSVFPGVFSLTCIPIYRYMTFYIQRVHVQEQAPSTNIHWISIIVHSSQFIYIPCTYMYTQVTSIAHLILTFNLLQVPAWWEKLIWYKNCTCTCTCTSTYFVFILTT